MDKPILNEAPGDAAGDEPEYIQRRQSGDNPLQKPSSGEVGKDHRFSSISGHKKQAQAPHIVGDRPVNVRGPDEVSSEKGREYVTARFNYRDQQRAQDARKNFRKVAADMGIPQPDLRGPFQDRMSVDDPEQKGKKKVITYFFLETDWEIPEDRTPNEFKQELRAMRAADDVSGPHREGGSKRYQITVQKVSGETESKVYKSLEDAEAAKAEVERQIKDDPVQGVAARRVAPGVSSLRARGMSQDQYFSGKNSLKRKHAVMLMKEPGAKEKIADEIGLDPKDPGQAKELEQYMSDLKGLVANYGSSPRELDALKPSYEGSADGQVHRVTGKTQFWKSKYIDKKSGEEKKASGYRQGKRALEFMWLSGEPRQRTDPKTGEPMVDPKTGKPITWSGEWVTPVEYSLRKRGQKVPDAPAKTARERGEQDQRAAERDAMRAKHDRVKPGDDDGPDVSPRKREVRPDDKSYMQHYVRILTAVGRHYQQSPITKDMADAMLAVARTTTAKGSPTVQSLQKLSDAVEELRGVIESRGEALTKVGKENALAALDAGYRILSQPAPEADEFEDEPAFDLNADRAKGKSLGQQMAPKLGIAKGANEPKSVGRDFERRPEKSQRRHVASAPGLPTKTVNKIPYEYRKDRNKDWDDVHDTWDSETATISRLTGDVPPNDSAWQALQRKVGAENPPAPGQAARTLSVHKGAGASQDTPGDRGEPETGDTKAGQDAPSDTPWRALSKLQSVKDDEPEAKAPRFDPSTLPRRRKKQDD